MPKTRKKAVRLTIDKTIKIIDFLKKVCVPDGKYVAYIDGYSDETVAKSLTAELGNEVTKYAVERVRRVGIGNLKDPARHIRGGVGKTASLVDEHSSEIVRLRQDVDRLMIRIYGDDADKLTVQPVRNGGTVAAAIQRIGA